MAINEKEIKGLSRGDLLELLLAQTERVEEMEAELAEVRKRAEARDIIIERSGTLAEAAMQINQVWQAADRAAAQYLSNVLRMYDEQLAKNRELEQEYARMEQVLLGECTRKCEALEQQTVDKCRALEQQTVDKCRALEQEARAYYDETVQKAKEEAQTYWDQVYGKLEQYCAAQESLKALLRTKG